MRTCQLIWILLLGTVGGGTYGAEPNPAPGKVIYQNDFQQAALDKLPEELLLLEGAFCVKADGGNRLLELPGAPVDTFGVLLGPAAADNISLTARVFGTGRGRRGPVFGIGLNGGGGYRLQIAPGKKELELFKGDQPLARAPYAWESGTWTLLRLQVRKAGADQWRIEGKAWRQNAAEPAPWLVSWEENAAPAAGRAALWGSPISGTPIWYDDVVLRETGGTGEELKR